MITGREAYSPICGVKAPSADVVRQVSQPGLRQQKPWLRHMKYCLVLDI